MAEERHGRANSKAQAGLFKKYPDQILEQEANS